jgi:hypothetical protein
MFAEDCPFKVVRTNGSDEVLARAANLLIGRAVRLGSRGCTVGAVEDTAGLR